MRKIKIATCIVFSLFMYTAHGQTEPSLPADGTGEYLDQAEETPIAGELYFLMGALGIGGYILLRKNKRQLRNFGVKNK